MIQDHEITAWLGDAHADMTPDQRDRFATAVRNAPKNPDWDETTGTDDWTEIYLSVMGKTARQYYFTIEASNEAGDIWQTVEAGTVWHEGSAIDLAEDISGNQNVVDGDNWRIRIFADDDTNGHPVVVFTPTTPTLTLLANQLSALGRLLPAELAIEAPRVAEAIGEHLTMLRRAAIYDATRRASWDTVAEALGVGTAAVNRQVTQHVASVR